MSTTEIKWMYQNDTGSGYLDCDDELNNLLEFFFTRRNVKYNGFSCDKLDPPVVGFTIPTSYNKDMRWTFNFDTMTQTSYNVIHGNITSIRRIIRTDSGKVWIWYVSTDKTNIYGFNNMSILSRLNSRQERGPQAGMNPDIINVTYNSKNPVKTITCGLRMFTKKYTCDDVIIELVDVNTLRPPVQGTAAPVTQVYSQPPIATAAPELWEGYQESHTHKSLPQSLPSQPLTATAAPVYSPQQSQLPYGWIKQNDGKGNFFYVNTGTGLTQWLPPGWFEYNDNGGRKYYGNPELNVSQYEFPVARGGKTGKTGKKKKRIIKRKKTYKKGRYTKRKTIKR